MLYTWVTEDSQNNAVECSLLLQSTHRSTYAYVSSFMHPKKSLSLLYLLFSSPEPKAPR